MANKINFITGATYTLAELFSEDKRIIIPDLQRDYCWGDDTNKKGTGEIGELVSDFVTNLIDQFDSKDQGVLNLGLFYGYEIPANHIQLCDGQQRLTTLFLLLGMLNKKANKFRHYLISDYEYKHDDKEPYLNYSIRETSLYFLSDLVCCFFIENNDEVKSIKESDWYFADYNLDPSIQSIINALSKIEKIISSKDNDWAISFGYWILNKLTFLYFDMQTRKNGEETFVVINTTGESLSATQNLKPLVIQEKNATFNNTTFSLQQKDGTIVSIDKCWEEIETWFWQNRCGDNDTADAGFAEFLRWVYMIEFYNKELPQEDQTTDTKYLIQNILQGKGKIEFPYKEISFSSIYNYWKALVWINKWLKDNDFSFNKEFLSPGINKFVNNRNAIGQNDCFVILPVMKYVYGKITTIETSPSEQQNTLRLYKFFENLIRISNIAKAVNSLVGEAIKIIDKIEDGEIVTILNHKTEISKQLMTEEEVCKLEIIRDSNNRDIVEKSFWEMQEHPIWNGEIISLINMAKDDNHQFQFDKYDAYAKTFHKLITGPLEHEAHADLLRRCMIVSAESYTPLNRGGYNTFAWEWNDWKNIISRNIGESRLLFDYVINNCDEQTIDEVLNGYISKNLSLEKNYSEFAKDNYLLEFTKGASCCDIYWGLKDWQICTTGGTGRHTSFFSRRNAYILKEYGANSTNTNSNKFVLSNKEWKIWYYSSNERSNCIVLENSKVKLDVRYLSEDKKSEVVLKALDKQLNITTLASNLNFTMKINSTTEAVCDIPMEQFDATSIKIVLDIFMDKITLFYQNRFS